MGTSAVSWFPGDVTISKIVDTRRAGSVKFDVTIKATSYNSNIIVSNLSADKLNEELTAKGLEDTIITSAPVGLDWTDANDKRYGTTDVASSSSSSSSSSSRASCPGPPGARAAFGLCGGPKIVQKPRLTRRPGHGSLVFGGCAFPPVSLGPAGDCPCKD